MLEHCDEIANNIKNLLGEHTRFRVERINYDLHPVEGYLLSTKKEVEVTDTTHNKRYKITIEVEE